MIHSSARRRIQLLVVLLGLFSFGSAAEALTGAKKPPAQRSAPAARRAKAPAKKPVASTKPVVPAAKNVAPSKKHVAPAAKDVASSKKNAAPAKKNVAPSKKNAAPAKKNVAPSKKNAAPAKRRYSASATRARRLKLAAARARAAREAAELAQPAFKIDPQGHEVPHVRAAAAIVYDPVTGEVLWEENSHEQRSIASITKLMTAVVFLESTRDLHQEITVTGSDVAAASVTHLRANERVRLQDLLHLMLISSDNAAARALARVSPLGASGFLVRMNSLAREFGLDRTAFADPAGLSAGNLSSAYDISRLIAITASDQVIAPILRKQEYSFVTSRRVITIRSTNKLLGEVDVQGGKTGFIRNAGYCFASLLRLPQGRDVAVVVLGARSSAGRFLETRHLFNWITDRQRR